MISYTSNVSEIVRVKLSQFDVITNPDGVLRAVASGILPELRKRVHVEGKDSNGQQIGVYSPGYMKVRTGGYNNAKRVTRGPNKGNLKDAGRFTKGSKAEKPRPKYNRDASTKVIASLTRQMENALSIIATPSGYGIGYPDDHNFDKSQWIEQTYRKRVWAMTQEEHEIANKIVNDFINGIFKNK